MRRKRHRESHASQRTGWLRAAVLGSNDAIVSTASLMIGVAASETSRTATLVAGAAGLVAGAMSMAVGEYVSVSSQRDAEQADIAKEREELVEQPAAELKELAGIYVKRGLSPELAHEVARQLSRKDVLAAHLRDELGIEADARAKPVQAAVASAASFSMFALVPIAAAVVTPAGAAAAIAGIAATSLAALACLGALGARLGGAPLAPAALRVTFGGAVAMAITAGIGRLLGVATG
jgi:VIT1/CCC1 family predicted Fe2+/Mn2+ transporter|nr:VIT family protein [Kofleriaceae bacterium]